MLITNTDYFNLLFTQTTTISSLQYYTYYILSNFVNLNYLFYYNIVYHALQYFFIIDTGLIISNIQYTTYVYNYFIYNYSFNYSIKFLISILILIFIRAGIPRYRYDFLTKLGWIKFFLYTFFFFICNYFIFLLF